MSEFIKADVFFFITSVAVLLITIGFLILIFYMIRILNDLRHISRSIRERSDVILNDLDEIREKLKSGSWLKNIFGLFGKDSKEKVAKTRKKKTK